MKKEKTYNRLSLLRKLKLIKQTQEINTLDTELKKISNISNELEEISKEISSDLSNGSISAWKLKSSSNFSSRVTEQLNIINNREKFISQEIFRAKKQLGKTHVQKIRIDKKAKDEKKINISILEEKRENLVPPIRK